jgi:hypothetical protein
LEANTWRTSRRDRLGEISHGRKGFISGCYWHDYRGRSEWLESGRVRKNYYPELVDRVQGNLTSAITVLSISRLVGTLGVVLLEIVAGLILVTGWYVSFVRYNRRKAAEVLLWIKTALSGHAQVLGIHWISTSRFQIRLRLCPGVFQQSCVVVQLLPREFAFNWLASRLKKQQELVTFEADLEFAPTFNLQIHNQRWYGRSGKKAKMLAQRSHVESFGPFVLTTRRDWQREITSMINALFASRDNDFLSVSFQSRSPHLSATVPLESLAPQSMHGNNIFHVLRELADCAGASRF